MTNSNAGSFDGPAQATTDAAGWGQRLATIVACTLVAQLLVVTLIYSLYAAQPGEPGLSNAQAQEISIPSAASIDERAWLPITLPQKLCSNDCTSHYKAYRLTLAKPEGDATALYVRTHDGALAVYLNGQKVTQSGSLIMPIADMTYHPSFVELPAALWQDGLNELDLIVAAVVPQGGRLTAPYVGASEELLRAWRFSHGLTIDALWLINGMLVLFLLLSLAYFFTGQRDATFLWFAAILVFCIIRNLNVLLPEWPASTAVRNALYLGSTLGVLLFSGGLLSQLAERRPTRFDRLLVFTWLAAIIAITVGMQFDLWRTWGVTVTLTRVLTLILGSWLLLRFIAASSRLSPLSQGTVLALLTAALTLMLHDTLGSQPPRLLMFQFSNLAAVPLVMSLCILLARRERQHVVSIEGQNASLKRAVAAREAELDASYAELSELRSAQILADERRRLMDDIHDGVAGRLAALLQRLRARPDLGPDIGSELRISLTDLRLIINSLDASGDGSFAHAMGRFREETERWLAGHEIELQWQIEVPADFKLTPEDTLAIYRLLQEALNNVIRHSQATQVSITTINSARQLHITIADNGRGFSDDAVRGRGITSMHRRATDLGATLNITSDQSGTSIQLCLARGTP